MHIHHSSHARHFTVLPNTLLRDRRLSFTARGVLVHLLSLPDGACEDVRTLADRNPHVGRRGVAKALDELVEHGYYVRHLVTDRTTGRLRTETHVYDVAPGSAHLLPAPDTVPAAPVPAPPPVPVPAPPGIGEPPVGNAGTFPEGKEEPGKEPSLPAPAPASEARASRASRAVDRAVPETTAGTVSGTAGQTSGPGRAAALLARLGHHEPKLSLSAADALALAPLAAPWLERGLSELETRSLLTAGLPPVVHSARALLADRLTRKLPAPRSTEPLATRFAECGECGHPLPLAQRTGICGECAGTAGPPTAKASRLTPAEALSLARTTLRARPARAALGLGPRPA